MMSVLGLPLTEALEKLIAAGAGDVLIERYDAPRATDARGTLRVVRQNADATLLTVCAFRDDINTGEICDESCGTDK